MLAKERENKILEIIEKSSAVTTSELVELFGVSVETVRKDLLSMEKRGLLIRVHGGALSCERSMMSYPPLDVRLGERSAEKRSLAKRAADFVCEGESIAVCTGSTAEAFAEELAERFEKLTVVTYSLDVFNILIKKEGFDVILIGGDFLKSENAFSGGMALDMLKSLHVKSSFVCASALSVSSGISDFVRELVPLQRALIEISDTTYFLADSTKFERHALLKISDMKKSYTYITDKALPEELYELYIAEGFRIYK